MTTEQKLGALEGLCERVYEMGKDILDPNVKDTKKIAAMIRVAGAFMGSYNYYKKKSQKYENEGTDIDMVEQPAVEI